MKGADIKRILNTRGFTQQEVADRLGKTLANLNGQLGKDDIRTGLIEDISRVTGIPMADFFQGPVGAIDFSPKPVETEGADTVPLLPIFAQAGHLTGWSEGIEEAKCERVISPVKDIDMAVHIYGESMYPDIPNGSVVYVRRVSGRIIDWGRAYILDTVDGPVLKYLTPGADEEHIRCQSANHDPKFAPFEVLKEDILGMYKVVMCMRMM
jgi:transcriptional regulator with XRE-family HTH domain